jgi:hypothetical protein
MSGSVAIPEDILLWPDDFWCFRNELSKEFLRGDNYRVVSRHSDEWLSCTREPGMPRRHARQHRSNVPST